MNDEIMYYDPMNKVYSPVKILVLGHGEHGKDEFAAMFSRMTGVKYVSSSMYTADRVVFPWFRKVFPTYYSTVEQCFEDRRNWRALWHFLISEYNTPDKSLLASQIMREYDAYIGMRCSDELAECINKEVFTHIFWVDAGDRVPPEDKSSNTIEYNPDTMCLVDNSGDLHQLLEEVELAVNMLGINK